LGDLYSSPDLLRTAKPEWALRLGAFSGRLCGRRSVRIPPEPENRRCGQIMADSKNGPELHPTTVELAQGANFGVISSVMPSGDLQTQLIWVHTDGERLVVNTEVHRQKFLNVERDPRVTLTIRDEQNPYRYAEARGRVVEMVKGQEARDHIDELSQKYHGQDYPPDQIKTERVMLWIVPDRQTIAE
jgi:PPOX class probable F420-dependent enzyme